MLKKNKQVFSAMGILIFLSAGYLFAQLDERFGSVGREGTLHLGQKGLSWYRDWCDSYLPENFPPPGKNKLWTVGKIDYRTDGLGMDYRWIILDLLEDTDQNFLQSFLNLCLAVVDQGIIPIIGDYWTTQVPVLEASLQEILDNFVYTDMQMRIKYRAKTKNSQIDFQEELPQFELSVVDSVILFSTSLKVNWTTHIFVEAWVLNPNPFHWGYIWKDVGNADCEFQTTVYISGEIGILGQGRERRLQVKSITVDSKTESNIDWSTLGIDFTWEGLSNSVENMIDEQVENNISQEFNKKPITNPYYFVSFFKSLFANETVPTQQEILDRIFNAEKKYLSKIIERAEFTGQYWSIGYEPNWFPLLEPKQYAAYFTSYYRLIKEIDPTAKVLGPPITLTEVIDQPGELVFSLIPEIFSSMFAGIEIELKNLVNSYFDGRDSKKWFHEFLVHLPADVKIDVNEFHIFPLTAEIQPIDWEKTYLLMDSVAVYMKAETQTDQVWVTEFGNIDWKRK